MDSGPALLPVEGAQRSEEEPIPAAAAPPTLASPSPHPNQPTPEPEDDPTTVWIGGRESKQTDLSTRLHQASTAERARRERSAPPIAVIDDDNLAEYAKDVKVTVSGAANAAEVTASAEREANAVSGTPPGGPEGEEYWRAEALRLRLAWRDAYDLLPDLQEDAARLRNDFYAADDPFYRDREIKPAWDRTLDRIEETKQEIERYRDELEDLMTRGRRAGALPGWLREGIELEPEEPLESDELEESRPGEPRIVG
jgi:hypothetical protein